jgi:hypothetical protein
VAGVHTCDVASQVVTHGSCPIVAGVQESPGNSCLAHWCDVWSQYSGTAKSMVDAHELVQLAPMLLEGGVVQVCVVASHGASAGQVLAIGSHALPTSTTCVHVPEVVPLRPAQRSPSGQAAGSVHAEPACTFAAHTDDPVPWTQW